MRLANGNGGAKDPGYHLGGAEPSRCAMTRKEGAMRRCNSPFVRSRGADSGVASIRFEVIPKSPLKVPSILHY